MHGCYLLFHNSTCAGFLCMIAFLTRSFRTPAAWANTDMVDLFQSESGSSGPQYNDVCMSLYQFKPRSIVSSHCLSQSPRSPAPASSPVWRRGGGAPTHIPVTASCRSSSSRWTAGSPGLPPRRWWPRWIAGAGPCVSATPGTPTHPDGKPTRVCLENKAAHPSRHVISALSIQNRPLPRPPQAGVGEHAL